MQRNATMSHLQNQPVADFHGLRDFYALVKTLAYPYRHSPQQRSYCNRTVLSCFIDGQMGSDPEFRNSIDVHFHSRCYRSGGIVQHTSSKLATEAIKSVLKPLRHKRGSRVEVRVMSEPAHPEHLTHS